MKMGRQNGSHCQFSQLTMSLVQLLLRYQGCNELSGDLGSNEHPKNSCKRGAINVGWMSKKREREKKRHFTPM